MFWENLEKKCKENHISVSKLCVEIGVAPSASNKWKNGGMPNRTTMQKIAQFFDVPVEYFYMEDYDAVKEYRDRLQNRKGVDEVMEEWANKKDPYKEVCSMILNLPEAKLQRVKDFVSGLME